MKAFLLAILIGSFGNFAAAKNEKEEKRQPAAVENFSGSVEINKTNFGISRHEIIQIVDRTNNIICYGKIGSDSSSISCLPGKSY